MRDEAKRLKESVKSEIGGVHVRGDEYRARIQYKDGSEQREIEGPFRYHEGRAQGDLEAIRAAGVDKPTRAECFETMQAEARILCIIFSMG